MPEFGQNLAARRARLRAEVDAERDRRIAAGTVFTVQGHGDIALRGTVATLIWMLGLMSTAEKNIAGGNPGATLKITDRDGDRHAITAQQMATLIEAGKAWVESVEEAAATLKAMDPVPADYTADQHWP